MKDKGKTYSEMHEPSRREKRRRLLQREGQQRNATADAFESGTINWDAYSHRQMWNMVKSAKIDEMGARASGWAELSRKLQDTSEDVQQIMKKLTGSWRGPSAQQATTAASALTDWGNTAAESAHKVGQCLDIYTSVVRNAAHKIPEPVHWVAEQRLRDGYDLQFDRGPNDLYLYEALADDHRPTREEAHKAKAEAVEVMQSYEHSSRDTKHILPTFDSAPETTAQQPTPAPPPPQQPTPPQPTPPVPVPGPVTPVPPEQNTDSTMAASAVQAPAPHGPTAFGGTNGSIGGFGGSVNGTPGAPGQAWGGGTGVLGSQPGTAGVAGGGIRGAAGASGAAGYGMVPPPVGGNNEDDRHHSNRYAQEADFLDDIPFGAPPVLGE